MTGAFAIKLEASGVLWSASLLLPILAVRKLDPMSAFHKFGVLMLALLLLGMPLLNCVTPAQAMTAAEKECCKKMAAECGRAGMAQSHSCCQSDGSPDARPVLKSAYPKVAHFALTIAYVIPHVELIAGPAPVLTPWALQLHSPPGETPPGNTVLRI